jgi:hypothetical protein
MGLRKIELLIQQLRHRTTSPISPYYVRPDPIFTAMRTTLNPSNSWGNWRLIHRFQARQTTPIMSEAVTRFFLP